VNNAKLVILLCGGALLGLYIASGLDFSENTADTVVFLLAYALPAAIGLMAMMKPPAEAWHGAIALAGFGVAAVRGRIWETLPKIGDQDGKGKAMVILLVIGLIASAAAMLKPEKR
jgi:hypothetical protein